MGKHQAAVDAALAEMSGKRIIERIWERDHTVWKPEPTEIVNRLGWLDSPRVMLEESPRLAVLREGALTGDSPCTHALLLGMGGSSLAPELFSRVFGGRGIGLYLAVLDSTDPGAVLARAESLDLKRTLFVVSTKSGGTVETLSFFKFFYNRVADEVGPEHAGAHFIAVTDPGSSLADLAEAHHFRSTFLNDPDIGGRYSALSYFGLAPAALVGVDIPKLLERADEAAAECGPDIREAENPGAWLGAVLAECARAGRDKLTLTLSSEIEAFGDWVEQLVAESTGKEGTGILPVVGESPGPPGVYGDDRLFVHVRLDGDDTDDESLAALEAAGYPIVRLDATDRYDLGGQFFLWEMATAVAGHRLGIHPFNQPDVEAAKAAARDMVAEYKKKGALPAGESSAPDAGVLDEFLEDGRPGDYIALQAFIRPTSAATGQLRRLAAGLRDRFKLATTVGYGPRFLHSTGQIHKGDAGRGLFVQLVSDPGEEVPIPDEAGSDASAVDFGVLIRAQAMGDRRALLKAGRRVITFDLEKDVAGGISRLSGQRS